MRNLALRLSVRALTSNDIEEVSILLQVELAKFEYLTESARKVEADAYTFQGLKSLLTSGSHVMLLAIKDRQIVGFIHASLMNDVAWLTWVVIKSDRRRKNIVWYLWKKLFAVLRKRGVHLIWGAIRTPNTAAQLMAHVMGFCMIGAIPNFLHHEDYILVSRSL